ncbi:hypothetical protein FMN50_16370 [Rhodobacterales bacterium]|nr:hypothetical protein FMN50_16370 [Rhodobacterales bacterium]
MTLPSVAEMKAQAKRLRSALGENGQSVSHSHALELLAQQYGFRDWNTASALASRSNSRTFAVGDRVGGVYLQQPFTGEILGIQKLDGSGRLRVTLRFDTPVDVVKFDSFSAYRSRVTCVIGGDGVAYSKTSNGEPHLQMDLLED